MKNSPNISTSPEQLWPSSIDDQLLGLEKKVDSKVESKQTKKKVTWMKENRDIITREIARLETDKKADLAPDRDRLATLKNDYKSDISADQDRLDQMIVDSEWLLYQDPATVPTIQQVYDDVYKSLQWEWDELTQQLQQIGLKNIREDGDSYVFEFDGSKNDITAEIDDDGEIVYTTQKKFDEKNRDLVEQYMQSAKTLGILIAQWLESDTVTQKHASIQDEAKRTADALSDIHQLEQSLKSKKSERRSTISVVQEQISTKEKKRNAQISTQKLKLKRYTVQMNYSMNRENFDVINTWLLGNVVSKKDILSRVAQQQKRKRLQDAKNPSKADMPDLSENAPKSEFDLRFLKNLDQLTDADVQKVSDIDLHMQQHIRSYLQIPADTPLTMDDYEYYLWVAALDMTIIDLQQDWKSMEEISEILAKNLWSADKQVFLEMLQQLELLHIAKIQQYSFEPSGDVRVQQWAIDRYVVYNDFALDATELDTLLATDESVIFAQIQWDPTTYWDLAPLVTRLTAMSSHTSQERQQLVDQIIQQWVSIRSQQLIQQKFVDWFYAPIQDAQQVLTNPNSGSQQSQQQLLFADYHHGSHHIGIQQHLNWTPVQVEIAYTHAGYLWLSDTDPLELLDSGYTSKSLNQVDKNNIESSRLMIQQKLALRKIVNILLAPDTDIDSVSSLTLAQQSVVKTADHIIGQLWSTQLDLLNTEILFTSSFADFISYSTVPSMSSLPDDDAKTTNMLWFLKQWLLGIGVDGALPQNNTSTRVLTYVERFSDLLNPLDQTEFELDAQQLDGLDPMVQYTRNSDGHVIATSSTTMLDHWLS